MSKPPLVALLVIIALLLVLGFQNSAQAEFRFLFWTFRPGLWVMLMMTALGGVFVGLLLALGSTRGRDAGKKSGGTAGNGRTPSKDSG